MIRAILSRKNLNQAYLQVFRNGGAGGVDGLEVSELSSHLQKHGGMYCEQIGNGSYQASAIKGVEIPKSNGKTRLLGIPTVVDRFFQQAVHQVLQPIFEEDFQTHSYGFRPGRNAHQALAQSQRFINSGCQDIVDIDLKRFFDEVDHCILLELIYRKVKCSATMKLLRRFLRSPIEINGKLHRRRKGVPQGSPLSPLLSNILLNELDKELVSRGHSYVRYADDFSIYLRSRRSAKRVGKSIYKFLLERLHLPINGSKSGIRRPTTFKLLGHGFVSTFKKGERGKYQFITQKSKWEVLKAKLKRVTRKTIAKSFDERLEEINSIVRGWINYFKMASIQQKLKSLDGWLRNRLRYCIWHDWKKPDRKRKNLIRLGVLPDRAYSWSRTRMGGWRVAQSPILGTTIIVEKLKKRGYLSMEEYYLSCRYH